MKKLLVLLLSGFSILIAIDTDIGKKPVGIKNVNSYAKDEYIVWVTEIKKDVSSDAAPIVTHTQKGSVKMGQAADVLDVILNVPQKEIDFSSPMPAAAAEIAGAVNPKAGAAAAAAAFVINEGLSIAGKALTKSNQRSPFNLTVVQIAPAKYYRILKDTDNPNGRIEITKAFKEDWKKWKVLRKQLIPVVKKYNAAVDKYEISYRAYHAKPNDKSLKLKAENDLKAVTSSLDEKGLLELKIKAYPIQRAAIMAVIPKEGKSCTVGSGPWQLNLFVYVGAKTINQYAIDFCVKNKKDTQLFNLTIQADAHKPGTVIFKPGGIELTSANNNITFPVQEGATTNYGSATSKFYDWNTEFVGNAMGDTIDQFLFPFDIYKMEQAYAEALKSKELVRQQADLDRLKTALDTLKSKKGQDELSDSDTGSLNDSTSDGSSDSESEKDHSLGSSDENEGYFPKLKEIKEAIDVRLKDSAHSVYAKKELELFNRIAENYLTVANIQAIAKEEDVKVDSEKAKELLFELNGPRVEFYTVQKNIKALSDSTVKSSLLSVAEDLVEATKLLIEEIKTGKKADPVKNDNGTEKPSKLKAIGGKALDLIKDNKDAILKHVPDLLGSLFGSDKTKK